MYVTCEVEVDLDDVLSDLDDAALAKYGLMRVKGIGKASPPGFAPLTPWHYVQQAMRLRDQSRLEDLISTMAWEQAGVILPAGALIIH